MTIKPSALTLVTVFIAGRLKREKIVDILRSSGVENVEAYGSLVDAAQKGNSSYSPDASTLHLYLRELSKKKIYHETILSIINDFVHYLIFDDTNDPLEKEFNRLLTMLKREFAHPSEKIKNEVKKSYFSQVCFDKEKSELKIDGKPTPIPYSSNQYYLCEALFGNPKKRWENDELLEKFGVNTDLSNAKIKRQPYDAMIAINKKIARLSPDLIQYKNKTFQINPKYL